MMSQKVCSTSEWPAIPEASGIRPSRRGPDLRSGNAHILSIHRSLPDQVVDAPMVESMEGRLDKHSKGCPELVHIHGTSTCMHKIGG